MSSGKVIVAVDALGADDAPSVVLEGVKQALIQDDSLEINLCGPNEIIDSFCKKNDRCHPLYASQEIKMNEHPAMAVRRKKDSSIVVGCKSVKEGKSDGFYSGGNTGACLSAATLFTGRIKGVKRPMLATNLPTSVDNKIVVFGDLGANADCKPQYLLQFAIMANAYCKEILHIKNPKIGLLNIGEEDTKGSSLATESYNLLNENLVNFSGNAEGRDILTGKFDAIITDGFTGNVVLKNIEGTFKMLFKLLKKSMLSDIRSKIGALLLKPKLKEMINNLDPESIGAALLFGIKGACCVGHGNSSAKAICNGILNTANFARSNVVSVIESQVQNIDLD